MKLLGLGFLVVGLVLLVLPILNQFDHSLVLAVTVPALALVFCGGLFYFNFRLHRKTQADTPWKGAVIAMILVITAALLSHIARVAT